MTLANELSRNGKRSGLTFAPEGGSERIRKVINKMVTEDDLIRTVSTAYANGWRQVKLYFMCGLPTETDEDVLAIADLARRVIQTGREVSGPQGHPLHRVHRRFRAQAAHPVPVGGPVRRRRPCTTGCGKLGAALRSDRTYGRSVGYRYHDGEPSIVEGLLSRGDRRVAKVIKAAWQEGARFDGWSEFFSFERWMRSAEQALADEPVDVGLVHDAGTRVQRSPALGSPGRGPGPRLALAGLAGRGGPGGRRGGRGLPLDPLLRLRRVPHHGHRDPDRPHRPDPAAAVRGRQRGGAASASPGAPAQPGALG